MTHDTRLTELIAEMRHAIKVNTHSLNGVCTIQREYFPVHNLLQALPQLLDAAERAAGAESVLPIDEKISDEASAIVNEHFKRAERAAGADELKRELRNACAHGNEMTAELMEARAKLAEAATVIGALQKELAKLRDCALETPAMIAYPDMERLNKDLTARLHRAEAANARMREKLAECLPIVSEAWYDNASAGWMPGSGYNHRVYRLVSDKWGWRKADVFEAWLKDAKQALSDAAKDGA